MKQQKRLIAWILCIGMLLVLLVSSACIAHAAAHDCVGEACEICQCIARTEAALHSFALLGVLLLAALAPLFLARAKGRGRGARRCALPTLVGWNVRLNN